MDKSFVKIGVEDAIDSVMDETVSDTGFVDVSAFRVGDHEMFVPGVCVGVIM